MGIFWYHGDRLKTVNSKMPFGKPSFRSFPQIPAATLPKFVMRSVLRLKIFSKFRRGIWKKSLESPDALSGHSRIHEEIGTFRNSRFENDCRS